MEKQHVMDPHSLQQTSPAQNLGTPEERRDSMEDADCSPIRFKRPRLDSGSRAVRKMSADLDEIAAERLAHDSASAPATPHDQQEQTDDNVNRAPPTPSRVTINVRAPQTPSRTNSVAAASVGTQSAAAGEAGNTIEAEQTADASVVQRSSPSNLSPRTKSQPLSSEATRSDSALSPTDSPVVELEISNSEDMEDEQDNVIEINEEEIYDDDVFMDFPFARQNGLLMASGCLADLLLKRKGWSQLNEGVWSKLAKWLTDLSILVDQGKLDLHTTYLKESRFAFWEDVANIFHRLLLRGLPYGEALDLRPDQAEEDALADLFQSYAKVVAQLLRAEVECLESTDQISPEIQHSLCLSHMNNLTELLSCSIETPFWSLIRDGLGANPTDICSSIMSGFFRSAHGLQSLVGMIRFGASHTDHRSAANGCLKFVQQSALFAGTWKHRASSSDRRGFARQLLGLFRGLDQTIQGSAKAPVDLCMSLIQTTTMLLQRLADMDKELAAQLATELLGNSMDLYPPDHYPEFIWETWQLKVLKQIISKGHMAHRIQGVESMSQQLVEMWSRWNKHGSRGINVLGVFAQNLLDEKVIDYIIGVDSHPQLISRSGNIVGFLVVSHKYSNQQTDSIWTSITQSQDPRMVDALIDMLIHCTTLMDLHDILYVCTKLRTLPASSFNGSLLELFRRTCGLVNQKAHTQLMAWRQDEDRISVYDLYVHLIQDSFLVEASTPIIETLHQRACQELSNISKPDIATTEDRYKIYEACIAEIRDMTAKAAPSAKVIHIVAKAAMRNEAACLAKELELTHLVAKELCSFVQSQRAITASISSNKALECRLELLFYLVSQSPDSISPEMQEAVWNHLVGGNAISGDSRDVAWHTLSQMVRVQASENAFLERCATDLLPKVEPAFYTPGLFDFLNNLTMWQGRTAKSGGLTADGILNPPGVELLWQVILTAPIGTIEHTTADYLAALYLDTSAFRHHRNDHPNVVQDTHTALIDRCIRQLVVARAALKASAAHSHDDDDMRDIGPNAEEKLQALRFQRTFLFLTVLLEAVRKKPDFRVASPRLDKPVVPASCLDTQGEPTVIRFQAFGGHDSSMQRVTAGDLETVSWLRAHFREWTGFSHFRVIHLGKEIDLNAMNDITIRDGELDKGHFIIIKTPDKDSVSYHRVTSVVETEILKNFDTMYDFMEGDDLLSKATFDFLRLLPPHGKALAIIYGGQDAPVADVAASAFPPGNPYKARYSVFTLDADFQHHLRLVTSRQDPHDIFSEEMAIDNMQGPVDDQLIHHGVQLLNAAILDENLINPSFATEHDFWLASTAVQSFAMMLRERVGLEVSSSYFSDEARLVDRLLSFLNTSLSRNDAFTVVRHCYIAIVEACLHNENVWEAFRSRKDLYELHLNLLLKSRPQVRNEISRCIEVNCLGLPEPSRVAADDMVSFYWDILSRLLADSVAIPTQSEQLFDLSAKVFRPYDALHRNEDTLRDYISSWSDLVLNYYPEVVVGRNDVDFVVLGFAKLLSAAVQSLKSFKKPLNIENLAARIFTVFLFPSATQKHSGAKLGSEESLPVLDGGTREQLYSLVIALCDDVSVFKQIVDLTHHLLGSCNVDNGGGYSLDGPRDLRSDTGYVGLENPQALCYMNSLMTQLFMDLEFRKFIFEAEGSDDDGLLRAMQELFANMQSSYGRSVDMRPFAHTVRGTDKKPINVAIQMDTEEFFRLLMDQLETQLQNPGDRQRLKDFYGGVSVNQIKSKDCEHVSERTETLFNIPLEVKGKETLEDSLKSYVEGESLEGENKYKCESCGGKLVNAVKRTCLKAVPDNLIMHLKRFDFDPYTLTRTKINDYFHFPQRINMSPYKVEYLSNPDAPIEDDFFELVGILVHAGGAEQGHYWSYIRVRPDNEGSPRWIKFNDDTVTEQDLSKVEPECYGMNGRHTSAYMLLYQRASVLHRAGLDIIRTPQTLNPIARLPKELEFQIAEDNERHIREYCVFDHTHSIFVQKMILQMRMLNKGICSEDHSLEKDVINMVMEHIYRVTARIPDYQELDRVLIELKKAVSPCATCIKHVLDWISQHEHALSDWLIYSYQVDGLNNVGHIMQRFIIDALFGLRSRDPAKYGIDVQETDLELAMEQAKDGALYAILNRLRSLVEHLHYIPRGLDLRQRPWDEYFRLLNLIANGGSAEIAALLDHDYLLMCLEICSLESDPELNEDYQALRIALSKKTKPCFNDLIIFMTKLIVHVDLDAEPCTDMITRIRVFNDSEKQMFPFSADERHSFYRFRRQERCLIVLNKCLEAFDIGRGDTFAPSDIIRHMLLVEPENGHLRRIYDTIEGGIEIISPEHTPTSLLAAAWYCYWVPDLNSAKQMVRTVAKCVKDGVGPFGFDFLKFYSNLTQIVNPRLPDQYKDYFYCVALDYSPLWATTLLLHEDTELHQDTLQLVRQLLTHQEPVSRLRNDRFNSPEIARRRLAAVRQLAGDATRCMIQQHEKADLPKSYIEALYIAIIECTRFLQAALSVFPDPDSEEATEIEDMIRQCEMTEHFFNTWPESDYDSTFSGDEDIEYPEDVVGV